MSVCLIRTSRSLLRTLQRPLLTVSHSTQLDWDDSPKTVVNDAGEEIPVITMPSKFVRKKQKRAIVQAEDMAAFNRAYGIDKRNSRAVVACSLKTHNHYEGQRYPGNEVPLFSHNWRKSAKLGRWFTIRLHGQNPSLIKNRMDDLPKTFKSFDLSPEILKGIEEHLGYKSPTLIQALSLRSTLSRRHILIGAETGCGKTLAYLVPVIEKLHVSENRTLTPDLSKTESEKNSISPRALILTNGRNLVAQIADEAEKLSRSIPQFDIWPLIRNTSHISSQSEKEDHESENAHYGRSLNDEQGKDKTYELTKNKADLVIGTPDSVMNNVKWGHLSLDRLQQVVVDEADLQLDRINSDKLLKLLSNISFRDELNDSSAQLILCLATLPHDLTAFFRGIIDTDNLVHIKTDALHSIQPHVSQTFLNIRANSKMENVLNILKKEAKPGHVKEAVLVFVNSVKIAEKLEEECMRAGLVCGLLHGGVSQSLRAKVLRDFQLKLCPILIATDSVARGLNTVGVTHVINYDFPKLISDYIHRCGRTGRVGSQGRGKVTNFIAAKSEVELVNAIELAARKRGRLPAIEETLDDDDESLL